MGTSILWHNTASNEIQNWEMDESQIRFRTTVMDEDGRPIFVGPPWQVAGTGDFDNDGSTDILWHNGSTGAIQIWFMKGAGIVRRGTVVSEIGQPTFIKSPWRIVGAGDFNRDGFADILWHNSSTNETQIWIMGETEVGRRETVLDETGTPILIGPPWQIVGARNTEILWHNSSSNETQIWFMNEARISSRTTVLDEDNVRIFVGPPWSIAGLGVFNDNGNADIIWHNSFTRETQIWFMGGPTSAQIASRGTVIDESNDPILIGAPWGIVGDGFNAADFTVPAPAAGLGSNSNYILTSECDSLLNVSVTIDVTEDIIWTSSSGTTSGFGFQLNAYSPKSEKSAWQQYVIALLGKELTGAVDNWPITGSNIINDFFSLTTLPSESIPAGYRLVISLGNDALGNVFEATYVVIDQLGALKANVTQKLRSLSGITADDVAPIIAFELNLVGPINGESAVLQSGACNITYEASNLMIVANREPACAESGYITAETANSFYGLMSAAINSTHSQTCEVRSGALPIRRKGKLRPGLVIPNRNPIMRNARIPAIGDSIPDVV